MRVLHETLSWEESSEQEGEGFDESLACLMTWIQWLEVRKTRKRKRENNRQRKTCELKPQDNSVLRLKFGRNFGRNRLPFPRSCLHFVLKKLDSQVRFSSSDIIVCFLSSMNPVDEPTQLSGFRTSLFLSSKSRDTHLVTSACALSNESEESCLQNSSLCHMFSLPDTSTSELLFPWNSREKRFSDQQRDQINTFFSSHLNLHFNWLHTKNDWQENVLFHCNCKIPARKFPEKKFDHSFHRLSRLSLHCDRRHHSQPLKVDIKNLKLSSQFFSSRASFSSCLTTQREDSTVHALPVESEESEKTEEQVASFFLFKSLTDEFLQTRHHDMTR